MQAAAAAGLLLFAGGSGHTADPDATVPEGYMKLTIAGGAVTSRINTVVSAPLLKHPSVEGAIHGKITSVGNGTLGHATAGWTPGALSNPSAPTLVRLVSGAAAGRTFLIASSPANTENQFHVDASDLGGSTLAALGVAAGDEYRLHACATLLGLFGTPAGTGVQAGASLASADQVQILINGSWQNFYFHSALGRWTRNFFGQPDASHLPIRPDSAVLYGRLAAAPMHLNWMGSIPHSPRKAQVPATLSAFLSTGWPKDLTLGTSGIEQIPGWISAPTFAASDTVSIYVSGSWRNFWHDGTVWRRNFFGFPSSDTQVLPASGGILLNRKTAAASTLQQSLPYTLEP